MALRPRGRATGCPREVQVAHTEREHVAGGHACPRVHADARVGRQVAAEGRHMEGPRVNGPS